jgi:signal transduction histidine kinase
MKNVDVSLYKIIADEAMLAILCIAPDGQCTYANQLALDLLELPLDFRLEDFKIDKLFPPKNNSQKRLQILDQDTLKMQGLIQEILIQKYNARPFIASLGVKHIHAGNTRSVLLMIQDVTLQKKLQREITEKQTAIHQAYQEMLLQNQQLKDLDKAKNRFLAITTHELRTPLSAMVASSELLKMKLYDNQEQQDEFINMIYEQGQHLLSLVNDILDFAKIQSNKMDYFIEEKDAFLTVKSEVDALQPMAESSKITLSLETASAVFLCYFDEVRLRQVLANLINNAIKYNKPNGAVYVKIAESEDHIEVYVRDTGKGIAKEDQQKVFNEFETLGKVAHHAKGTGLGLPISQRMILAMGGDLKLESTESVGSTFWIVIPKKKVLAEENYRARPDASGSGDLAA